MKIGIEASAVFRKQKTGVGYYAYHLVKELANQLPDDELSLEYISFITKQPEKLNPSPGNVKYRRISLFPGKLFNALDHYLVPPPIDVLAGIKADVWFFPNFFRWPLWLCRKSVVVIHDIAYLDAPQYVVPRHRKYLSRRVPQSIHKATHVVAVSEHTKKRLVEQYGTDPGKITVVEPALDLNKYKPAPREAVQLIKEKYGITRDYILFLGTMEPRKNVSGVIKAYQMLPPREQEMYQLVLAGGKGWLDDEINELAKSLPARSIVRTGYVADGDEPALFTGATLFVWPSHYEGWGMPLLESMACGTPAVSARNSSLMEAGGDAAAYVDQTEDPAELSGLLLELLNDPARRERMREAGLKHAPKFTWEASAKKLAEVLKAVGKK